MAQPDAIMRYIRELSELSGRIRYAGQKRILIEMALIRLCRPQMEISQDSLLDRLRAVEQQLEKGIVMQAPEGPGHAGEPLPQTPLPEPRRHPLPGKNCPRPYLRMSPK